jgi:hypothetical protein
MIKILDDPFNHQGFIYGVEIPLRMVLISGSFIDMEEWIKDQGFDFFKRYREYWFVTSEERLAFVLAWA